MTEGDSTNSMKTGTIASTLVALSLGASLTACGGAELSDGSQLPEDETASGEIMSDFEPEFDQVEAEITACDDQQYDHWRNLSALAVASANELGRWNAAKDFTKVWGPAIGLSAEGLARCTNGCDNVKAILELQNDTTKIIPRHDPALLRQYMVAFYERQVNWNLNNPIPDHSLKLAAVSADVCGFRYHFDVTGATTTSTSVSGTTEVKPVHSGKCLDVAGASSNDGAAINQYGCWGGNNQKFTVESQGNNTYRLKGVASGKCIGVVNGATNDGAGIEQRTCGANNSQLFQLNNKGNNTFELKHVSSGKCVDVKGNSTGDSVGLQLWSCHGGANQAYAMNLTSGGSTSTTSSVNPGVLFNQLKFAGELDNKFLMFQSTATQVSIDPMATMISGGSTATSGSCSDGATAYGEGLAGDCCSVSGKLGTLVQSPWNKKLFYCK
jgi:hypothetical protein